MATSPLCGLVCLDGSGKEQSLYGVAEWTGSKDQRFASSKAVRYQACFLRRAATAWATTSMRSTNYRWNMSDVWGYCDGDQPIVVIPLTQPMKWIWDDRFDTAAGVLVVQEIMAMSRS